MSRDSLGPIFYWANPALEYDNVQSEAETKKLVDTI